MMFMADCKETSCSAERPPNSIPTLIFLAIVAAEPDCIFMPQSYSAWLKRSTGRLDHAERSKTN
jgi:hypothetical protein